MDQSTKLSNSESRVALVKACWHKDLVDRCCQGFFDEMARLGYPQATINVYEVPGSLEIPLAAKLLAKSGAYSAVAAAGFIVNGGIYRHEFVAQAVIDGIMRVQLETEIPVLSAVLTPQHFHGHEEHRRFFLEHLQLKGHELAAACVATIENIARVRATSDHRLTKTPV
jgi:6,7-dimethyl-8-ribityllumazine synthase